MYLSKVFMFASFSSLYFNLSVISIYVLDSSPADITVLLLSELKALSFSCLYSLYALVLVRSAVPDSYLVRVVSGGNLHTLQNCLYFLPASDSFFFISVVSCPVRSNASLSLLTLLYFFPVFSLPVSVRKNQVPYHSIPPVA